jgi:hypothetical protein
MRKVSTIGMGSIRNLRTVVLVFLVLPGQVGLHILIKLPQGRHAQMPQTSIILIPDPLFLERTRKGVAGIDKCWRQGIVKNDGPVGVNKA